MVNAMIQGVCQGTSLLLRDFQEISFLQSSPKGLKSLVSGSLRYLQKSLCQSLMEHFPEVPIFYQKNLLTPGFESRQEKESLWVEISGLTNFTKGIPHFGLVVSLKEKGLCQGGLIFDPIRDELFWVHRGKGAYKDKSRLKISHNKGGIPILGIQWPKEEPSQNTEGPRTSFSMNQWIHRALALVEYNGTRLRTSGAFLMDMAYVAAQRLSGVLIMEKDPNLRNLGNWDLGTLFIEESQGGFFPLGRGLCLMGGKNLGETALAS